MSKKARRRQARRQQPRRQPLRKKPSRGLIALGIGGLLLIVAAVVYFTLPSGTPKLAVDREKIDFGYVKFNTRKTFAIHVTNTGDGVLKFKQQPSIKVLAGC